MAGFFEDDAEEVKKNDFFEEDAEDVAPGAVAATSPESAFDESPSLGDIASFIGDKVKSVVAPPLEFFSKPFVEMDKMTGAPLRSGASVLQKGGTGGEAAKAAIDQLMAGIPKLSSDAPLGVQPGVLLPEVPTGEDMARYGMSKGSWDPKVIENMAPIMGMGIEGALDITQLIPTATMQKGMKIGAKGLGSAARGLGKAVETAEMAAARPLMAAGQVMTQGAIDPEKALKAASLLSSRELIFPGTKDFGAMAAAGRAVGNARTMIQFNQATVPGSHSVALQMADMLEATKARTIGHPNADKIIGHIRTKAFDEVTRVVPEVVPPQLVEQAIDAAQAQLDYARREFDALSANYLSSGTPEQKVQLTLLQRDLTNREAQLLAIKNQHASGVPFTVQRKVVELKPRDLSLDELDDITGMFDELVYTGQGNERRLRRVWGPAIKKSRAVADKIMQTIPEGQLFKEKKSKFEALATAGKTRSKLLEAMSLIGTLGTGAMTMNPTALLILGVRPRTYFQVMGLIKAPREIVSSLALARQSGKAAAVREALIAAATKYPDVTERIARSIVLVSGKPEGQQFLTEEEAATLGKNRVFDPEQIAMERERLKTEPSLNSVQRARALNAINKNGYIINDRPLPDMPEEPDTVEDKVFGGPEGLRNLLESLQAVGGEK